MDLIVVAINNKITISVSLLMFLFGLLISFFTIYQHFLHYNVPRLQIYITRLHIYVPVYSILNLLIFSISLARGILIPIRELCEAIAIYSFMCLMLEYCGGVNQCGESISNHPATLKHIWPVNNIPLFNLTEDIPLNAGFVKMCKKSVLQYAFVRVFFSILAILITLFCGDAMEITWFSVSSYIVYNISISIALYGLSLLYFAIKDHPQLKNANPIFKFISFKLLIFATYWQGLFIVMFIRIPAYYQMKFGALLLLMETPIFCIVQRVAFNVSEFIHEPKQIKQVDSVLSTKNVVQFPTYQWIEPQNHSWDIKNEQFDLDPTSTDSKPKYHKYTLIIMKIMNMLKIPCADNIEDFNSIFSPEHRALVFNNAMAAMNLRDMIADSFYNFSKNYREHVILSLQEENEYVNYTEENGSNEQMTFAEFDQALNHLQ